MAEDQHHTDNVEIEPLSDEELEHVAGGDLTDSGSVSIGADTSTGPSCCSCTNCSPRT